MSVESLAVVLQHAPFAGRDKLILVGIANHDGDGGAWPAIGTLARYANCSISSAKRSLAVLIEAGAITRDVQAGGVPGRTPEWAKPNRYEIHIECPANCDKTRAHRPIDPKAGPESMLWINPRSTLNPGPVVERGGSPVVERGGSPVVEPRTIQEPSTNLNTGVGFESTSPAAKTKCWACGNLHPGKGSYCTGCSSRGFNTPIISCTDESCGLTMRRIFPGQQSFTCKDH